MTQIALIVLALVAAVATAVLARARAVALARATAAERAAGEAEHRTVVAEHRLTSLEGLLRESAAEAEARRLGTEERAEAAEQRARAAEDTARQAEDAVRTAQDATREATRQGAAATARAEEADRRLAAAEEHAAALLAEVDHLARERVAATAVRLTHANAPLVGPLDPQAVGPEAVRALQSVLDATTAALADERERVDAAARAAMRGATSRIQTLLYQIQSLVQQLQHDNDDPRLLEVDFRNEVALRRIQTVAVLCEAWPGLARTDSPLAEVVVGALSRVPGYARIKVANHLREHRLAVVARAAEPIAVTIAELLANATAYSHPETDVPVTVQQGGRGALVIIDDSGIGMEEDQLRRARRLLAGPPDVLLTELGNPPKTGFAVVGKLARQYGFSCHIEPSPYGGMRTILRIPAALVTVVDDEQPLSVLTPLPLRAGSGPAPAPTVAAVPPMRDADQQDGPRLADRHNQPGPHPAPAIHVVPAPGTDGSDVPAAPVAPAVPEAPVAAAASEAPDSPADDGTGLPTRRRRRPLAAGQTESPANAAANAATATVTAAPDRTPERAAAHWQALQQGTDSGRAAAARAARAARAVSEAAVPENDTSTTTADRTTGPTTLPTSLEGAEQ
ncbi:signal transduction histidine kinase [Streptomyces sp. 1114.5]|uniref:ATP-binding protein n=1 Tax=Streptomyces sp. 1114.5 TaxID=1938830 RepID=UPI000EB57022|nr:ATP-binding protein [Streptomyces sp. 1114.5]RKT11034.1 signal transduction histidine kinase [Streptomyces sp. 1114.5]